MRQNDDFRCGARSQVLPRITITSQLLRVWNYRGARERTHAEAGGDRAAGQLRCLLSWRGGDSLLQRRAHLGARKQRTGLVSGKDPATEVARLGRDLPRQPAELGVGQRRMIGSRWEPTVHCHPHQPGPCCLTQGPARPSASTAGRQQAGLPVPHLATSPARFTPTVPASASSPPRPLCSFLLQPQSPHRCLAHGRHPTSLW